MKYPGRTVLTALVLCMLLGLTLLAVLRRAPAALAMPAAQTASQRYVQSGGNDIGNCTDPANPCGTIAYALSVSFAGSQTVSDTINIAPGNYKEALTITKYIILQGPTPDGSTAQIDGQGTHRVIQANAPRLTINNLTIQNGNAAGGMGGGINISGTSAVTIRNSFIVNNHADEGGGISGGTNSAIFVTRSTFSNNLAASGRGGAILDGVGSTTSITASAIISNSAVNGGGIFSQSSVNIVNSTLSDNNVSGNGGAINTTGTASLSNVTVFNNTAGGSGGGIYAGGASAVTLRNTILAGNIRIGSPDCSGAVGSQGFNLIGDNTGCTFSPDVNDTLVGTGGAPINPLLGALTSYGSYTMYRLPQTNSPAVNAGNNITGCADGAGNLLLVDQRSTIRPQNGRCDIGAVEIGNAPGLSSIDPNSRMAASAGFPMTLSGLNFSASNPQVLWYRNGITTTYTTANMASHSTTQIVLNVPASAILSPGTALVSVQNPPGGPGYVSGALPFTIDVNPAQLSDYLPIISKQ